MEVISDHIIALFGAKVLAYTKHDPSKLVIDLEKIDEAGNGATFIHTSSPGKTSTEGPGATCESRIDELFLDVSTPEHAYRLETYRSQGGVSATASQQLRCYFVTKCNFPAHPPASTRTDGCVLAPCAPADRVLISPSRMERANNALVRLCASPRSKQCSPPTRLPLYAAQSTNAALQIA